MKKWFWAVGCDNKTANPFVGDQVVGDQADLGEYDGRLHIGQAVEQWPGTAWVKAGDSYHDGDPDDVLQTCLPDPLFSPRLRSALETNSVVGVQYLPIHVFRPMGELISGFSIANVLNCIDALDLRLSKVQRFPSDYFLPERRGRLRSVDAPVLIESAIEQYDIIRISTYTAPLYVSERFVRVFEAGRFTGYSFHEVPTSQGDLVY